MTPNRVIYVTTGGETDTVEYEDSPTPKHLSEDRSVDERLAVVEILDRYEVLDLRTINLTNHLGQRIWTIGPPVAVFDDLDAAITFAVLTVGGM
jgi:hypothetical protein